MKTHRIANTMFAQILLLCFFVSSGFAAMELPSKLSQVPVFPGSKIVQVMDMGSNAMASLEVKTDSDALMKFYKKEMQDKGWKAAFQAEQADTAVIHFTKDNQTVQISAGKGDQGALVYQMVFVGQ
jgi:hypothetical protein